MIRRLGIIIGSIALSSVSFAQEILLDATEDVQISEKSPDTNFGAQNYMRVTAFNSSWEGGGDGRGRALVRFSLPTSLDPDDIASVVFEVFQTDDAYIHPGSFELLATTSSWSETGVTWNSQPATDERVALLANASVATLSTSTPQLLELVRNWSTSPSTNHGILIRFEDEFFNGNPNGLRGDTFASRESLQYHPPRLRITLVPAPNGGAMILGLALATSSTRRRSRHAGRMPR